MLQVLNDELLAITLAILNHLDVVPLLARRDKLVVVTAARAGTFRAPVPATVLGCVLIVPATMVLMLATVVLVMLRDVFLRLCGPLLGTCVLISHSRLGEIALERGRVVRLCHSSAHLVDQRLVLLVAPEVVPLALLEELDGRRGLRCRTSALGKLVVRRLTGLPR